MSTVCNINFDLLLKRAAEKSKAMEIQRQSPRVFDYAEMMNAVRAIGSTMVPGFRIDDCNRFVYSNLCRWLNNDAFTCVDPDTGAKTEGNQSKGIFLSGGTGTGKSVCLEVMSRLADLLGFSVRRPQGNSVTSLSWKSQRADRIVEAFTQTGDMSAFKGEPVLCIQDLGSEPADALYMGNRVQVLKQILESRGDRRDCITIISSNLNYKRVGEVYGERAASRLYQMCNYFVLTGRDRRR